jgi:uncharacterized protein YchJ
MNGVSKLCACGSAQPPSGHYSRRHLIHSAQDAHALLRARYRKVGLEDQRPTIMDEAVAAKDRIDKVLRDVQ